MSTPHIDAEQVMLHATKLAYRMSKAYNKTAEVFSNPNHDDGRAIFTDALSHVTSFLSDDDIQVGFDARLAILDEHITNFDQSIHHYLQSQINKNPQEFLLMFLNNFDTLEIRKPGNVKNEIQQAYERLTQEGSNQFAALAHHVLFYNEEFHVNGPINIAFNLDSTGRYTLYNGMASLRQQYIQRIAPQANKELIEDVRRSIQQMQKAIFGRDKNIVVIEHPAQPNQEEKHVGEEAFGLGKNASDAILQYRQQPGSPTEQTVKVGP